jgi:acyl dehydratase
MRLGRDHPEPGEPVRRGDRRHQWIHVDPQRAKTGPFGGTIAHGYLTHALAPRFIDEALHIDAYDAVLNYGLNKVRFPAPVPVGAKIRAVIPDDDACSWVRFFSPVLG